MELRIKELQEKAGLKNVEFAKLAGIGVQQINYYRVGKRTPPLSTMERIAKVLNCTVIEMLPAPDGYFHEYENGEWLGIRKKN